MKQLYVCSRPMLSSDGTEHRHLIGILSQLDDGEYQFEYKLQNTAECESLILPIFPNLYRTYNDAETRVLLDDYLPSENDTAFMREILKKTGLDHYDEWEWLRVFESADSDSETILCETLPEDIIRHDDANDETDIESDNENDFDDEYFENDFEDDSDDNETSDVNMEELLDDDIGAIIDGLDDSSNDSSDDDEDSDLLDIPEDMFADIEPEFISNAINLETTETTQAKKPKTQNTITTVIIKTTHKRKRTNTIEDFIEPAPESPMELLQQRLEANQKKRQEELAEKLKEKPYG